MINQTEKIVDYCILQARLWRWATNSIKYLVSVYVFKYIEYFFIY